MTAKIITEAQGARSHTSDPLVVHVVSPDGRIKGINYAYNIAAGPVLILNTRARRVVSMDIDPYYAAKGWAFLEDLYADDPNPAVRDEGFAKYLDYFQAGIAKKLPRIEVVQKERQNGVMVDTQHDAAMAFPEAWLPAEVVRRRDHTEVESTWAVPKPPPAAA